MIGGGPPPTARGSPAVPIEVTCGKCGETLSTMGMLKPVKEAAGRHGGRCPGCGQALSLSDFSVEADEK